MLYTDKVVEFEESLRVNLAELRKVPGSKKLESDLSTLESDLDLFLEACEELIQGRLEKRENVQDAFDLWHRQLSGLSEKIGVFARRLPEQPIGAFRGASG